MRLQKQLLDQNWFACPEAPDSSDLSLYTHTFERAVCKTSNIPLTLAGLFLSSKTPLWCYHIFKTDLRADPLHRLHLCFDRVVCLCQVWVNGIWIGQHNHSEEAFSMDITDALTDGENLIACRIYAPITGEIGPEGISMKTTPNYAQIYSYYPVVPKTGIFGHVALEKRPCVALIDRWIKPDCKTGDVEIELTFENRLDRDAEISVDALILDGREVILSETVSCVVLARETKTMLVNLKMESFSLWTPDSPNLYTLNLSVKSICGAAFYTNRFGFKDFSVIDGYFHLNGKRVWLACAHTFPSKEVVVHAKTMGFNALRYLSEMPPVEILDFCDEIGMMVYEECAVSWGMSDYPGMEEHMAAYLDNMIRRDRNHVCVAIWGVFNEQPGPNTSRSHPNVPDTSRVFDTAVSYLPEMRKLDPTRLILLSSGRWDARATIGSFSNPGSDAWDYGWGSEGPNASECAPGTGNADIDPYITEVGDVHLSPTVPIQNDIRDFVRNIGRETNPVFLSEYGVGYQLALYDLYLNSDAAYGNIQMQRLEEWIEKYNLHHVYPTPRDFLMASVEANAAQRIESIDPIRANPKLCGYSLTSFTVSNEGVYYCDHCLNPGVVDALRDSFASVKWSFFTESHALYPNTPFEVEAVLCNMDTLMAGTYDAVVSVSGKNGVVWREQVSFVYPEGKPLAASVMTLMLPGFAPGAYVFSVHVAGICQPSCASMRFRVLDDTFAPLCLSVYPIGAMDAAMRFLSSCGAVVTENPADADVICVGTLNEDMFAVEGERILQLASEGKRVLILDDAFWQHTNTSDQRFMGKIEFVSNAKDGLASVFGYRIYIRNWLYHMDNYIADSDVFGELADLGILDTDLFKRVYPDHYMIGTAQPQKTICAAYGSGLFVQEGCLGALTLGEFAFGSGSVLVNTFKLLGNVGSDPVADRILYNLVRSR